MKKKYNEESAGREKSKSTNRTDMVLRKLSKKEMRVLTEELKTATANMQKTLLIIDRQQGWLATGCITFKEYIFQEFGEDQYPSMYDKLRTAQMVAEVAGEEFIGVYSSNSMIPFRTLKSKQRHKVWRELQKECGDKSIPGKWLTRSKVDDMIDHLYPNDDAETGLEKCDVKTVEQNAKVEKKQARNSGYVSTLAKAKKEKNFPFIVIDSFVKTFGPRTSQKALNYLRKVLAEQDDQNED